MADTKHPSSEHHHNAAAHQSRQQPIIIGKLLIIMKAVGTIEEKNIRRRPRNTAGKRMGTPPLHIRIQTNRNSTSVTLCVKAAAASLAAVLRLREATPPSAASADPPGSYPP